MISMTCLCRFIYNVTACSTYPLSVSARRHTLSRARHLSMDAWMTRCSTLNQAFNRCYGNLLCWYDVRWRQRHSEKTTKLNKSIKQKYLLMYHFDEIIILCIDFPGWQVWTVNIPVSQGNVATYLRWGGKFYSVFVCSSSQNAGVKELLQESPADARVARDSSACIPPSWIFEISKLHH